MSRYNKILSVIIEAKEQIKSMLAIRRITMKKLAEIITENSGRLCSPSALSNRLRRGTITYNEVMKITDLLGFKISYKAKEQVL